jgi:MFS-type transporter involved in bile tolerance (Atg22 family)
MIPIGSLLIGAVSHRIGVQATVLMEGLIALGIAILYGRYLKKERLRKEKLSLLQHQSEEELIQA